MVKGGLAVRICALPGTRAPVLHADSRSITSHVASPLTESIARTGVDLQGRLVPARVRKTTHVAAIFCLVSMR